MRQHLRSIPYALGELVDDEMGYLRGVPSLANAATICYLIGHGDKENFFKAFGGEPETKEGDAVA